MIDFNLNIQAHLFVGFKNDLEHKIIDLIQTIICKNKCRSCVHCIQISNKYHEQLTWLNPEQQYNLSQIDNVIENICLKLDHNKKHFIIFERAELLTVACSNRLLKSIEEPPAGYYFIFLAERYQLILPTIISRCVVTYLEKNNKDISQDIELSEIGKYFIIQNPDSIAFLKSIEKSTINEYETIELLDKLIYFWSQKYKKKLIINDENECQKIEYIIKILYRSFENPPMPGANKIFWKNLFIQFLTYNI